MQIYGVSLDAFSLNTALVWVGNTMNTQMSTVNVLKIHVMVFCCNAQKNRRNVAGGWLLI